MCTLTFVATKSKFIITHNRDEQTARESAIEPKTYFVNNKPILFPKDPKAGGTWFAVAENGTVLVLLNGAAEKHSSKPYYRKSRGLIVLDLISAAMVLNKWEQINLTDIEPFTLMLFEEEHLYQLQWNGENKFNQKLDSSKPYIWSSSTLYSQEIRDNRAQWFRLFLENNKNVNELSLIDFHQNTETNNTENGLIINRNGKLKTLSITQSVIENKKVVTNYSDLVAGTYFTTTLLTT